MSTKSEVAGPIHISSINGTVSEYKAALYFLRSGVRLYWPAFQSDHLDFVILENDVFNGVQVKSAYWKTDYGRKGNTKPYPYLLVQTGGPKTRHLGIRYDRLVAVYEEDLWDIPATVIKGAPELRLRGTRTRKWDKYLVFPAKPTLN